MSLENHILIIFCIYKHSVGTFSKTRNIIKDDISSQRWSFLHIGHLAKR